MLRFGNSMADITTTVLTLTLTGLAVDSSVASGSNPRPVRRICSIVALFLGALFGAYLLRYGVALPLFVTGACVLLTMAAYAVIAEHSSSKSLESYERSVQRSSVVDTILVRDLSSTGRSATR